MTLAVGSTLQHLLPQRLLCRCTYRLARTRIAWIKTPLIRWFSRHYRVDMNEAERAHAEDYASFNEFFTRALKPGARPLDAGRDSIVAPCDGTVMEIGTLERDRLVQAKGITYSLPALLGEESPEAESLLHGSYATIYLAPRDYHRVHTPVAGRLLHARYIPGDRYSVNAATASAVANLFCRNERVVCWLDSDVGRVAIVLVGALNVSSISITARGEVPSGSAHSWRAPEPVPLAKGAELGRFNLGSTVIALFPRGAIRWDERPARGDRVLVGVRIGRIVRSA
jgi:phosphatidylserine decarboxylase